MKLLLLLTGLLSVFAVPIPQKKPIDLILNELARPKEACVVDGGYNFCPSLGECVRPWEVYCQEFQFPYNALWYGSGIIMPARESSQESFQDNHSDLHISDSSQLPALTSPPITHIFVPTPPIDLQSPVPPEQGLPLT